MGVWIENGLTLPPSLRCFVTPCMGVWIEKPINWIWKIRTVSLPVWECGLKNLCPIAGCQRHVTPCMGVWIEIQSRNKHSVVNNVTPCMGVWIEILNNPTN